MIELVFKRTCNYWIDSGIVGLYDTLQKPVLGGNNGLGNWEETIKCHSKIRCHLSSHALTLKGEEKQIDQALSYALEWVRLTLYDVSTEKQIANPERDGRIKQMSTLAGKVVASGKQAKYTYFRQEIIKNIGKKNIFLPLKQGETKKLTTCVFCGQEANTKLALSEANEVFVGQTLKSSPFVEGDSSNRCFHSNHKGSVKCWRCGFVTFFSPLLLFYRRRGTDTYYILPYVPGNLKATHLLYRSLSGKRGLARVLGSDHTSINYESAFKTMPLGMPLFTLSFYYDLYSRLLPQNTKNLLQASEGLGLIDERGAVFQTSLFLKRDTTGGGRKSFILRETTIDRSAYFIKLFLHLKRNMDAGKRGGKLFESLQVFFRRASETAPQLQRLSVLRAAFALTEGKHVYRYLLSILSVGLKGSNSYEVYQISMLFQVYDQWLFRKEDKIMANMVEQANNAGYYLSQNLWRLGGMDENEKQNLIKRYYYAIERAPSPVKFLEQARHAYHKAGEGIPIEMVFHDENGKDDIKKFEVYRVYFLAGMLNGMLKTQASAIDTSQEAQKKED